MPRTLTGAPSSETCWGFGGGAPEAPGRAGVGPLESRSALSRDLKRGVGQVEFLKGEVSRVQQTS